MLSLRQAFTNTKSHHSSKNITLTNQIPTLTAASMRPSAHSSNGKSIAPCGEVERILGHSVIHAPLIFHSLVCWCYRCSAYFNYRVLALIYKSITLSDSCRISTYALSKSLLYGSTPIAARALSVYAELLIYGCSSFCWSGQLPRARGCPRHTRLLFTF